MSAAALELKGLRKVFFPGTANQVVALEQIDLEDRLTLAALPEADNGILGLLEMRKGYLGYLFHRGNEIDPLMGGRAASRGLRGEAANALRIAHGGSGQWTLPSPVEDILGRKTVIL